MFAITATWDHHDPIHCVVATEEEATRVVALLDTFYTGDDTAMITVEEVPNVAC